MNIAGKGVLLIIAVITVGIIVLNQGFDKDNSANSAPVLSTQEPLNDTQEQNQEIEEELAKVEKEIKELKKSSISNMSYIAADASAEIIKQIIDAEVNKSNVAAIVNDIIKKRVEKHI